MPTRTTDDQATHTFRAATLEEAVAIAEQTLGRRVSLVAANRIRRGGLGGFFAADLGVEVVVAPIEETVESALERLIATTSNDEKARWEADRTDPAAAIAAALSAVVAGDSAPAESPGRTWLRRRTSTVDVPSGAGAWYSPPTSDHDRGNRPERLARLAELDRRFAVVASADGDVVVDEPADTLTSHGEVIDSDPTGRLELPPLVWAPEPTTGPEPAPSAIAADTGGWPRATTPATAGSPGLARVERIIEELQALTSTPRLMAAMRSHTPAPSPAPTSPRRAVASSDPVAPSPLGSRPAPGMVTRPSWPTATRTGVVEAAAPVDAPAPTVSLAIPRALAAEIPAPTEVTPDRTTTSAASVQMTGPSELSQRQVELAVSAADALIGSLRREDGAKRVSVRVVLRSGDHEEVAAEAEWDADE